MIHFLNNKVPIIIFKDIGENLAQVHLSIMNSATFTLSLLLAYGAGRNFTKLSVDIIRCDFIIT